MMWSRSTSATDNRADPSVSGRLRALTIAAGLLLSGSQAAFADPTSITVVYPKADEPVTAVDSTFIFGNVAGDFDPNKDWLDINGHIVEVHRDGGFLAFLPIASGQFEFRLRALHYVKLPLDGRPLDRYQLLAETSLKVTIPSPRLTLPGDTVQIAGDYRPPSGDLILTAGDILPVMFQGTPDLAAWFSLPGVIDSVPMSEMEPHQQPYWGESVFGVGAVPDSVLIGGVYAGFYQVAESVSATDVGIVYHLARPLDKQVRPMAATAPSDTVDSGLADYPQVEDIVSDTSDYLVSLNDPDYPFTVQFIDSVQTIRHAPWLGYFSIFQPQGVKALAVGREGDWYRLKLSHTRYAWANANSVMALPPGILPPTSRPTSIRTYGYDSHVLIEIALRGKHPVRVVEDDARTVRVQLFGVTSNTDWIRYDFSDPLIDVAAWSQPEERLYELRLQLSQDLWGYDTYYEGNTFYLRLNRAPERIRSLWGKTVVVDPGHSSDAGAIGPTGLTEAEANLDIALVLRRVLEKKGARVVMTRDDMSHVPLYERPVIAKLAEADLFVSVHNNALPDGVNPFTNHGVSTYYYHPHSIDLARAIQKEMLRATGLPDFGLYHGNLAVNRPTQYPAVLVECTFMMIPEQEALLKTDRFRRKVARAITKGLETFLQDYDRQNR